MRKFCVFALSLIFSVCTSLCAVSLAFGSTETEKNYYVVANGLTYGQRVESSSEQFWCGAPSDVSCYLTRYTGSSLIYMNPGTTYNSAICFTAPADGTIVPNDGCIGLAKAQYDYTQQVNAGGVRVSVFLNNDKIFPSGNDLWQPLTTDDCKITATADIQVSKGDKLYMLADNGGNGNTDFDTVLCAFTFKWTDAVNNSVWFDTDETYYTNDTEGAQKHTTGYAKKDLVSYAYVTVKELTDIPDVETEGRQIRTASNSFQYVNLNNDYVWAGIPMYSDMYCHVSDGKYFAPGTNYASSVCFTAPCSGTISNALGNGTVYRQYVCGEEPDSSHPVTDKTRICIVLNDVVVYPTSGVWADVPQGAENKLNISFNTLNVQAGDKLQYIIDNGGQTNSQWDTTILEAGFLWKDTDNPNGVFVSVMENFWTNAETDGAVNVNFGSYAKKDVFQYNYVSVNECTPVGDAVEYQTQSFTETFYSQELIYSAVNEKYYDLTDINLFAFAEYVDPGFGYDLGVEWTAPENGRVDISKSFVCNYQYQSELDVNNVRSDGVKFRILINGTSIIYPTAEPWLTITNANKYYVEMQPFAVNKGDKITFVLNNNKECNYDICNLNLVIDFAKDGENYTDTYDRVKDFGKTDACGTAWKYYMVDFITEQNETVIDPIKVIEYGKGNGCAAEFGFGNSLLIALSLTTFASGLTVKKKKEKTR